MAMIQVSRLAALAVGNADRVGYVCSDPKVQEAAHKVARDARELIRDTGEFIVESQKAWNRYPGGIVHSWSVLPFLLTSLASR